MPTGARWKCSSTTYPYRQKMALTERCQSVVVKFFWTRRSDGRVMHRRATGRQGWPAFRTVRVIGSQVLNLERWIKGSAILGCVGCLVGHLFMFLVGGKTPDQSVHLNLTTTSSFGRLLIRAVESSNSPTTFTHSICSSDLRIPNSTIGWSSAIITFIVFMYKSTFYSKLLT